MREGIEKWNYKKAAHAETFRRFHEVLAIITV